MASHFSQRVATQFFSLLWNENARPEDVPNHDGARQNEKPADPPAKFGVTTGVT
jgi:hypothetical protein